MTCLQGKASIQGKSGQLIRKGNIWPVRPIKKASDFYNSWCPRRIIPRFELGCVQCAPARATWGINVSWRYVYTFARILYPFGTPFCQNDAIAPCAGFEPATSILQLFRSSRALPTELTGPEEPLRARYYKIIFQPRRLNNDR